MSPNKCADLLVAAAYEAQASPIAQERRQIGSRASADSTSHDTDMLSEGDGRPLQITAENLAEALTLNDEDIESLREIAPLISISPRRAKRFLSIYLVIRARALGDPVLRQRLSSDADLLDVMSSSSLLVLVALLLGLPKTMAPSMRDNQFSYTNRTVTTSAWLSEVVHTATDPEERARLQTFLNPEPSVTALPLHAVMRWLPVARPYLPLGPEDIQDQATGPASTANTDPQ
jgi:hypothetical protein